ncbi:hypothetical protein DL96DRAFT_1563705 [Flagelloscypha sp. PMI_526]|nr:hypothetical protein DL96DRAFT_1563705 [Flagelloscypha sp. PMI_526]
MFAKLFFAYLIAVLAMVNSTPVTSSQRVELRGEATVAESVVDTDLVSLVVYSLNHEFLTMIIKAARNCLAVVECPDGYVPFLCGRHGQFSIFAMMQKDPGQVNILTIPCISQDVPLLRLSADLTLSGAEFAGGSSRKRSKSVNDASNT